MKVSREMFRTVRWLLGGLLVLQLIIVPWSHFNLFSWEQQFDGYAPIFAKSYPTATVNVGLLLVQLAVTGGLLLLWLRVAKPEESVEQATKLDRERE